MPPDILVFRAPTRRMNPRSARRSLIAPWRPTRRLRRPSIWRSSGATLRRLSRREAVETCLVKGRYELLRNPHVEHVGGTDLAGGGGDEYGQTIAHAETREGRTVAVLDCLVSFKPPCSPEEVVKEFATVLHRYGVQETWGDAYAGEWPREHFHKCGIDYRLVDKSKSDLYRELLPAVNSGLVELLDHPTAHLSTVQFGAEGGAGGPGHD